MEDIQLLSKVLESGNIDVITHNGLNSDYFPNYNEEFKFIVNHYKQYGKVPDKETFLTQFPDFTIIKCQESDAYLLDKLNEQYLFNRLAPVLKKVEELINTDSRKTIEYLQQEIPFLTSNLRLEAKDIVKDADERIAELERRKDGKFFITTGFKELDNALMGWQRGEDLVTIIGRVNEGKCLIKGTEVIMADGSRKLIEDIKEGDRVLSNNLINTVYKLHHGFSKGYKIIPTRGQEFIISEGHILTLLKKYSIKHNGQCTNKEELIDISIEDYLKLSKYKQKQLFVYRPKLQFCPKKLDIPPYILGIWLGDGCTSRPELCNMDQEIIDSWYNFADSLGMQVKVYHYKDSKAYSYDITNGKCLGPGSNKAKNLLRKYNLLNNKHIPPIYHIASETQRLELLAGIIDTDGWYSGTYYEISTKLETLAKDYRQLASGLGFKVTLRKQFIKINGTEERRPYYQVKIFGDLAKIPVKLGRKKCNHIKSKRNPSIARFSIKEIPQIEYFGFSCDGDNRFLLGDGTLTHNSWVVLKFLEEAWKAGYRVGLYSGEMSSIQMGFRFDTIYNNFSNFGLTKGNFDSEEYKKYIHSLKEQNSFFIVTPEDLGGNCTVSKLEAFIQKYKLDILGVDQYSLMEDEEAKPNQPLRTKYDNISKGLFLLSCKYHIPILAAVQANRNAVLNTNGKKKEEGPKLEHISESDAIAHNSSRVIAMRQNDGKLEFEIVKNRIGGRNGKYLYRWLIDTGKFEYVPTLANNDTEQVEHIKKQFRDKEDVF